MTRTHLRDLIQPASTDLMEPDRPDLRYLDAFVQAEKSAADLLALGIYPNAKEITEAVSPWNFCRKFLGDKRLGDSTVRALCVADGHTPRAAAYFAFRSRWQAFSIDPALGHKARWGAIQRLRLCRLPLEDFIAENLEWLAAPPLGTLTVIVAMHAHCRLDHLWRVLPPPKLCIACPCCDDLTRGMPEERELYTDIGVISPRRTVYVWRAGNLAP